MKLLRLARRGLYAALLLGLVTAAGLRGAASLRERRIAKDDAPAGGRFVKVSDAELFLQTDGPDDGAALLLIHGTGAWSETWKPTMKALAGAGYRSIAVDLPPFGYSSPPADRDYSRKAQARRLRGLLDAMGVPKAVLVGHSFGGGATVTAAAQELGRIEALVLVDVALGWPSAASGPASPPSRPVAAAMALGPLRNTLASIGTNPSLTKTFLGSFLADPRAATNEIVYVYRRPLFLEGKTVQIGDWLQEFLASQDVELATNLDLYRGLQVPALVLWGRRDSVTPLWQGERLASLLPRATLVTLDGIGHIPQIEDPPAFQAALLSFLNQLPLKDATAR